MASSERDLLNLLLIPLDDSVVFPHMTVTLPVDVGQDERVLLAPRSDGEYGKVGVVAEVVEQVRLPGGGHAVVLNAVHRAILGAAQSDTAGRLRVEVDERPDDE